MAELLGMDEPRRRFAAMMSSLDIHYDLGEGHPLLGRRMPNLALRVFRKQLGPELAEAALPKRLPFRAIWLNKNGSPTVCAKYR